MRVLGLFAYLRAVKGLRHTGDDIAALSVSQTEFEGANRTVGVRLAPRKTRFKLSDSLLAGGVAVTAATETLTPTLNKPCPNCPPLVVPRRGYTPSRPSCASCAEKHLGAAYVLLTETRDGYAHRLRAIGHLFEAEDESQAWPELHHAIREARRAYQATGAMPDWDALAAMLAACQMEPSSSSSS